MSKLRNKKKPEVEKVRWREKSKKNFTISFQHFNCQNNVYTRHHFSYDFKITSSNFFLKQLYGMQDFRRIQYQ